MEDLGRKSCLQGAYGAWITRTMVLFKGIHSIQDLIWCVEMGVYIIFWVHRGF